jgi:uncharacterized Tic20 family protein
VIKLSTLLIVLGGLLAATTVKWWMFSDRHTVPVVYQHAKAGKLGVTMYAKIVAPVSFILIVAGMYLALTWR